MKKAEKIAMEKKVGLWSDEGLAKLLKGDDDINAGNTIGKFEIIDKDIKIRITDETEKAKWNIEKDNLITKYQDIKDKMDKLEKKNELLTRENEKLKNEKNILRKNKMSESRFTSHLGLGSKKYESDSIYKSAMFKVLGDEKEKGDKFNKNLDIQINNEEKKIEAIENKPEAPPSEQASNETTKKTEDKKIDITKEGDDEGSAERRVKNAIRLSVKGIKKLGKFMKKSGIKGYDLAKKYGKATAKVATEYYKNNKKLKKDAKGKIKGKYVIEKINKDKKEEKKEKEEEVYNDDEKYYEQALNNYKNYDEDDNQNYNNYDNKYGNYKKSFSAYNSNKYGYKSNNYNNNYYNNKNNFHYKNSYNNKNYNYNKYQKQDLVDLPENNKDEENKKEMINDNKEENNIIDEQKDKKTNENEEYAEEKKNNQKQHIKHLV